MNDFSEIEHGFNFLTHILGTISANPFINALQRHIPEFLNDELKIFTCEWKQQLLQRTYISSLSTHLIDEDQYGRLSMWRAYGAQNGVALIINPQSLNRIIDLPLIFNPVIYTSSQHLDKYRISNNFESATDFLNSLPTDPEIKADITNEFMKFCITIMICTKHIAFSEEREWRIFTDEKSLSDTSIAERIIHEISGIPQHIVEVKLDRLSGTSSSHDFILDDIIIGPSEYPYIIRDSIQEKASRSSITRKNLIVQVSGIPLRQN